MALTTQKNKAAVLGTAIEYLSSLKAQLEGLMSRRNQHPEGVVFLRSEATSDQQVDSEEGSRLDVRVTPVSDSSTSGGERIVELEVRLRGHASPSDLIISVLEFLKQVREASLVSMEAQTHHQQSNPEGADQSPIQWMHFRLRLEVCILHGHS